MITWTSVEHFMTEFLQPFLKKSYNHLEIGGHLVLYIEDRPENPYIELMKRYVKRFIPGLNYEGAFYYEGAKPRPYYVWKKTS